MNRRLVRRALVVSAVAALAGCTDNVGPSVVERFTASLTGANERPTPVTSSATGAAEFQVFDSIPGVFFKLSVTTIDSVTAAHIHGPADSTQAAGVIVNLYTGGTIGALDITGVLAQGTLPPPSGMTLDSVLALMRSGKAYVNVHTRGNPGGELRGQIVKQP